MKNVLYVCLVAVLTFCAQGFAQSLEDSRSGALHLMSYQSWGFTVDSTPQGQRVRHIIAEAKRLGFKTVIFNFRGHMITGRSSDIRSTVPLNEQATEERLLIETAEYAKSLGLKVAFRPILLVVGPRGEFPYVENKKIYWWHGVIAPKNVDTWFESYFKYHERYLKIAARVGAEWYSVGAEMNSMTSGLGERFPSQALGYPKKWTQLVGRARAILGTATKITYGVNYTDQYVIANKQKIWGGEFEQWRVYLTDSFKTPAYIQHQKDMRELWQALDEIGIDYYRAMGSPKDHFGNDLAVLVKQLSPRAESHASQLDTGLTEIAMTVGYEKSVFFQEMGYRSVDKCFLEPASYEDHGGKYNLIHQAAAWEGFLKAFWEPQWPWMAGVGVWQVLVDTDPNPATDKGFSPLGKAPLENVFIKYFKP